PSPPTWVGKACANADGSVVGAFAAWVNCGNRSDIRQVSLVLGRRRAGLSSHAGDENFCPVTFGLNVDGDQVLMVVGDDRALAGVRRGHHRIRQLRLVEVADLVDRIVALQIDRYGVNSSKARGGRALLQNLGPRINIHSYVASGLLRIIRALNVAKWSLDLYVTALLPNVRVACHAPGNESDRSNTENSNKNQNSDDDQDDFERTASLGGRGLRCSGRRGWGGGSRSSRCGCCRWRRRYNRRTTFAAESGSGAQSCAAGIAERHRSPRADAIETTSRRREYTADESEKGPELAPASSRVVAHGKPQQNQQEE